MVTSSDIVYLFEGAHGVCCGVTGRRQPAPACGSGAALQVPQHPRHAMRIFRPDQDTLAALPGSGIGLILSVGGVGAVRSLANSRAAAIVWVHDNVRAYYPDVLIRYIAVSNEVPAGNAGFVVLPAMRNVHAALVAAGLSISIKVSTAVRMDVIADSYPPSAASSATTCSGTWCSSRGSWPTPARRHVGRHLHEPVRRHGGRHLRRAGEGRGAERQGRRVGDPVAVRRRVRGDGGQRAQIQPGRDRPRPAGHAQEARGAGDVHVCHVQREPEAGGSDGEKLWALLPGHAACVPDHLPKLTWYGGFEGEDGCFSVMRRLLCQEINSDN
ncbi:hypothetical protein GQ55_5G020600 [Panicum hallii var. hallii]|uniref:Glucan endo-1,3-beta-D-glucosidase n=1 Tax=Panicum hallii var. hallii TaxID=1504633 RepID=A0A2T7DBQ3_9POAL|nr:hypothetical protein GQ55_5G020600 [Panicum hallii var. hallii]